MTIRIGIIGANGQVGMAICRVLAASSDAQGVAVVRNRVAAAAVGALVGAGVEIRIGSVGDRTTAADLVGDCQAVVNCAFASGGGVLESRRANFEIFDGVQQAAPDAFFVHLSSVAVYGPGPADADQPKPDSSYGKEKLEHERYLLSHVRAERLLLIRLGHVYGADTPVSRFILDCLLEPNFELPVPDDAAANAVSIDAVAASLVQACLLRTPTGLHHLADQPNGSWRRLFDLHAETFGLPQARACLEYSAPETERLLPALVATLRSCVVLPDLSALSTNLAVRKGLDSLLAVAPAVVEGRIRRWYKARVVGGQAGATGTDGMAIPNWLHIGPVGGRHIPVPDHAALNGEALAAWGRRVLDPRWSFAADNNN